MTMLWLGIFAFAVMAVGDINDALFKLKLLKLCFPIGLLLLIIATAARISTDNISILWCAAAAVLLVLELYALFGSFSVSEAYTASDKPRTTSEKGLYSLCRHPGVPFFIGLYICLHFGVALPWTDVIIYAVADFALALFEDIVIFPRLLGGYDDYKKRVPFVLPGLK